MKKILVTMFFVLGLMSAFSELEAHCQVPCGIYDDHARIHLMQEHVQTIQKARKMILELQAEKNSSKRNYNQIVRWVMTKEKHATDIQNIANEYFLVQRIKLDWPEKKRNTFLNQLHKILVYAMKCKQSLNEADYSKLNQAVNAFEQSYIGNNEKHKK
ncbi:superoxide dismutase, Ni [bacterium]|nr:superoxide dismutase, Ni [bacterium]